MRNHPININLRRHRYIAPIITLCFIAGILAITLLIPSNTIRRDQTTPNSIQSLNLQMALTQNLITSPTATLQNQPSVSQSQNDISIANTIIILSAFFLGFIAIVVAIADFFGVLEFRRIRQLSKKFEAFTQPSQPFTTQNDTSRRFEAPLLMVRSYSGRFRRLRPKPIINGR
jgi:hypothetical protein